MKTFPGSGKKGGDQDDLDALLGGVVVKKGVAKDEETEETTEEGTGEDKTQTPALKKSDSSEEQAATEKLDSLPEVKTEVPPEEPAST